MKSGDIYIGFIGAGNMANALIKGLIKSGIYSPEQLAVSDNDRKKLKDVSEKFGIKCFNSNKELVREYRVIVLSIKPQVIREVLEEIKDEISDGHLIISIAAGIPIKMVLSVMGRDIPIIRVMPNTPVLIQRGISVLAAGGTATPHHMDIARKIFDAVGKTIVLEEGMMDAVTALSGSGPGFIFRIMESFVAAAEKLGFDRDTALLLVTQTFLGASHLADESDLPLSRLREMVTSPGGTTAAGLNILEKKGISEIIEAVLKAAHDRSIELGKNY
ncbi:MAG TPA: pyrroline-5-carboxylate reductase [Desulfatiglandales bacterium]|nr:pyrroline-5-carboxylate reductase [Desulfatiglandales bacterium]